LKIFPAYSKQNIFKFAIRSTFKKCLPVFLAALPDQLQAILIIQNVMGHSSMCTYMISISIFRRPNREQYFLYLNSNMKKLIDQSSNKDITLKDSFLMKTFYEQLFPLFL
jgi:hypothetical protein